MSLRKPVPFFFVAVCLSACSSEDPVLSPASATDAAADAGLDAPSDVTAEETSTPAECVPSCQNDTRCVGGTCEPWAGASPTCVAAPEPFAVQPDVNCHWPPSGVELTEGPPEYRWARAVTSTVVGGVFERPEAGEFTEHGPMWLVFATGSGLSSAAEEGPPSVPFQPGGVLRVLDPQSCELVDTLDEVPVASWFQPPAIGDLDGDGVPEIVAQAWDEVVPDQPNYQGSGYLVAWKYDEAMERFRVWKTSTVNGELERDLVYTAAYHQHAGPSIADLDDDGAPEVVLAGRVYTNELERLTGEAPPVIPIMMSEQPLPNNGGGPFIIQLDVIADIDGNGTAELVYGNGIFSWSASGHEWVPSPFFQPTETLGIGHAVLADMGTFPGSTGADQPEVVVLGYDGLRIQSVSGQVLKRFDVLGAARGGGAPSIANVDDDVTPEIIVGTDNGLFTYDLGCDADTPPAGCGLDTTQTTIAEPLPRGVRWADRPPTPAWDFMGGTTFDFDGDGALEVLYADECFLRMYDGASGKVLFSRWRPSRTASEVPVVLGTRVAGQTVVAIGSHTSKFCQQATGEGSVPDFDPQFPGLPCDDDADCWGPEGSCRGGLCRCTADEHCCAPGACEASGYACREAEDEEGNTCRAVRIRDDSGYAAHGWREEGIDVFGDRFGRWATARPIWNQDAYAVTGVNDDGTIPSTSEVSASWSQAGGVFRANVAGDVNALASPDLTVRDVRFTCSAGSVTAIGATVCNRGARSAPAGQSVRFEDSTGALCAALTTEPVEMSACVDVQCAAEPSIGTSVKALVNPLGKTPECDDGNNEASAVATCSGG